MRAHARCEFMLDPRQTFYCAPAPYGRCEDGECETEYT